MIKKFYIFISIILFFLLFQNKFFLQKKEENTDVTIDFSNKRVLELDCEIKKSVFKKNLNGLMFIKNNKYRVLLFNNNLKKIDIGCNEDYFWYWSEREEKNTLFYSDIRHMDMVMKKAYKPSWMFNVFKKIDKKGESFNILDNNKIISKAVVLDKNIIEYSLLEEGIVIKIIIKNALNQNFDEGVFAIPFNEYFIKNKMIPNDASFSP